MRSYQPPFLGLSIALFLASAVGITPVYAQDFGFGGGPPGGNSWTAAVNVPGHCIVVDTDGGSHTYATNQFLGICALQTAIDAGSIPGVQFSNAFPSLGLFVTTVGGVVADPNTQYWALYQNGSFASMGLSQLPVAADDTIVLELHDFSDNFLGSRLTLNINSLVSAPSVPASPSGGSSLTLHDPFDIPLALAYLVGHQRADGSFSSALLSDWAAIAFAGGGAGDAHEKLRNFFVRAPSAPQSVTDYERHAMALLALGVNPYSAGGIDYIQPIVDAFDQTQIGDPMLVNDDIFALFPLMHAGYSANDEIIRKTAMFIISKQSANGSWNESVDMTAAAVQALVPLGSLPNATAALASAKNYLHAQQQADGGFGSGKSNISSTSWVIQTIYALGDGISNWTKNTLSPIDYLAAQQDRDGSVPKNEGDISSRIWATSYAIPAAERKSWDSLLSSFPKPVKNVVVVKTATEATSSPTNVVIAASTLSEFSNTFQRLLDVVAKNQKAPAERPSEKPASNATTSAEMTADIAPHVFPQFVQTAAVATVNYGIPLPWLKWIVAVLLCVAFISGIARQLRKRRRSQKLAELSEQKQE